MFVSSATPARKQGCEQADREGKFWSKVSETRQDPDDLYSWNVARIRPSHREQRKTSNERPRESTPKVNIASWLGQLWRAVSRIIEMLLRFNVRERVVSTVTYLNVPKVQLQLEIKSWKGFKPLPKDDRESRKDLAKRFHKNSFTSKRGKIFCPFD